MAQPSLTVAPSIPKSATAVDRPVTVEALENLSPGLRAAAERHRFEAKPGQVLALVGRADEDPGPEEFLVGLGPGATLDLAAIRLAATAYIRAASGHRSVACTLAQHAGSLEATEVVTAAVEGLGMASYRYTANKGALDKPEDGPRKVTLVGKGQGLKQALKVGQATVQAITLTRDLVNEPGGSLVPAVFADRAKQAGEAAGLTVTIWDEKRIAKEKLGGLLAVAKGSTHRPRFVTVKYSPAAKPSGKLALIGKGITFDSGGLSLKTGQGMMSMKIDMAGAATVLGAMTFLPALGATAEVTAYLPLTDNMVNGDAQRPGDVFTARNGVTVEVLNTDAEGRLVLADALAVAAEAKPDAMVDIATLTGSVSATLGLGYVGLMTTDDSIGAKVEAAADETGEKVWRLPLPSDYRSQIDSTVADIKNISAQPYGGALVAGLFLKEFTDGLPWAHLDMGMAATSDSDTGVWVKGATGWGVRTLARLAADW